ncbi:MAG: hypothetical protein IPN77_09405 [Sandaracinaceae bacterium]|nr:hypothetical protein [Sandaracinaceae bacterium]
MPSKRRGSTMGAHMRISCMAFLSTPCCSMTVKPTARWRASSPLMRSKAAWQTGSSTVSSKKRQSAPSSAISSMGMTAPST